MASLKLPRLDLKIAKRAMKEQLKREAMRRLKNKLRSAFIHHLAGFWWVYAILFGLFVFLYFMAAVISSSQSLAASAILTERFLPPQIYHPDLENLITDGFGERVHPVTGERSFHTGIDIGVPIGTPVSSSQDGVVTSVIYPKATDPDALNTGGINVAIESTDEEMPGTTRYLHLSNALVGPGQTVKKGQIIGLSGNTGRSTGPHLHFEYLPDGKEGTDPSPYVLFISKITDIASEAAFSAVGDVNFSEMNGYDFKTNPLLYISHAYIETAAPSFNESGTLYTRDMNTGTVLGSGAGGGYEGGGGPVIKVPTTIGVLHNPFFIQWAPYAMDTEKRTGIKASVTLAQMALESNWGSVDICNNVFGIKANSSWKGPVCYSGTNEEDANGTHHINAAFRAYPSYTASFDDHALFLIQNPRYTVTRSKRNPFEWANELQRATYATDGQYANKLKTLMMNDNLMSLDQDRGINPETGEPWKDVPYDGFVPLPPSAPSTPTTPSKPETPIKENTSESITITFGIEQLYGTYGRQVHRTQVKKPKPPAIGTGSEDDSETEEQVSYTNLTDPYTGRPVINLENYKNVVPYYSGELEAPNVYVKDLPDAIAVTLESSSADDLHVAHVDFVKGQY
ncbi:glucosaminidase domain-containing protein [Paenibacillus sp. GCM10023250]|uniref:glucosaminidase domain-containing protein n=1 Tax=Paenibacillus sp. GCM10023250 TaxID=3252648 RepID=UPI00360DB6CA